MVVFGADTEKPTDPTDAPLTSIRGAPPGT